MVLTACLFCGALSLLAPLRADKPATRVAPSDLASGFEESGGPEYNLTVSGVDIKFKPGAVASLKATEDGAELGLEFLGANPSAVPEGEGSWTMPVRYYVGAGEQWRSSVRYSRIRYRQAYPGIDLVFRLAERRLEFDIELAPHADIHSVRIRWFGLDGLTLDAAGAVVGRSNGVEIRQLKPDTFQETPGTDRLTPIDSQYKVSAQNELAFSLGEYDHRAKLTVDPQVSISAHFGGAAMDTVYGTLVDEAGNIYLAGETASPSFRGSPITSADAWIMKLDAAGSHALYLTFLGGSSYDSARAIAVDAQGNIYVTGVTNSTDFIVVGGVQTGPAGTPDAFVAKLNASGQVVYSTYLGGPGADYGLGIAVDGNGAAYIAGQTASVTLATSTGSVQSNFGGGYSDCFAAKLNPAGNSLAYLTFLGGSAMDLCSGIAVDASGNAVVSGTTSSSNFPLASAFQTSLKGSRMLSSPA